MTGNIAKAYKKTNPAAISNMNKEAKCITKRLYLDDAVKQLNQWESFVTLKDHKENFQNNSKCRLLNAAKSKIGKTTSMNEWQNMQAVITWFKTIKNKRNGSFIKSVIVDFYPSILKDLLTKCINYAKSIATIEEKLITIVFHARKLLLLTKPVLGLK